MSFNLAQFRRDQLDVSQYLSDVFHTVEDIETPTDSDAIVFLDKAIEFEYDKLQYKKNYYLRVRINQISNFNNNNVPQQIEVTLETNNETNNQSQYIDNFVIPYINKKGYSVFEIIISPNSSFDLIKFTLHRNAADYLSPHKDDSYYGRTMEIEVEVCAEITNILGMSYNNNGKTITIPEALTKVGVQGPPGLLMCINGEGIRIGPSGIYEINSGYTINFMGYILRLSDQRKDREGVPDYDYFIMDYQY